MEWQHPARTLSQKMRKQKRHSHEWFAQRASKHISWHDEYHYYYYYYLLLSPLLFISLRLLLFLFFHAMGASAPVGPPATTA